MTSQKNVGIEGLISVLESQAHLIIYSYHLLHLNRPELDLTIVLGLGLLNPLSPKSDQRQISPCNINAL